MDELHMILPESHFAGEELGKIIGGQNHYDNLRFYLLLGVASAGNSPMANWIPANTCSRKSGFQ